MILVLTTADTEILALRAVTEGLPFDVRAAKAAGMFAVAVTWGRIHDRARLEAEQPDAIVDRAEELLGVL